MVCCSMDLIYDTFMEVLNDYWPQHQPKPKIVAAKYADASVGNVVKVTLDTIQISYPTIYTTPKHLKTQFIINGQFDNVANADSFNANLLATLENYTNSYISSHFFKKLLPTSLLTLPNLPTGAISEAIVSAEAIL